MSEISTHAIPKSKAKADEWIERAVAQGVDISDIIAMFH